MNKLRFKVVTATSEDENYPSEELNHVNPSTKGWQSVRFCSYPQEVGLEILDGDCRLNQLQVLSHQSKISSRIELFVGSGPSYHSANFKRLGYLSLDSNERSSYTARELKTVFVDHSGNYVKLLIGENHVNKQNIYNQVGIVAVSLMGTATNNSIDDSPGNRRQMYGAGAQAKAVPSNPYNDLSFDMNLDPQTTNKLRQLADAKSRAIETEDYLTAKQIKTLEQDLKKLGSRLAQLNLAKSDAVVNEDYDLAKEIKDECDELRLEIEDKVRYLRERNSLHLLTTSNYDK